MERDLSQSISVSLLWVRSVIKRALTQDALTVVTLSCVCLALSQKSAIRNKTADLNAYAS